MGEMTRGRRSAHGRPPVRSRCAFAVCAALAASLAIAAPAYAACGPVALDPGHGGTESGASGFGLREEVLNWKVANYCKERLDQLGIPNFLTKQDYETLSRMERNRRAEARNARVLVSFHFNSGGGRGAEVLVTNTSTWNRFTNTESSAFGRDLLGKLSAAPFNLQNRLIKTNNWVGKTYPDGSVADSMGINYYPRLNGTTGLIIEHAFIDNLEDAAKLKSEGFLKQLGYADAEAIARHWPNSYVKPAASTVATNKNGWYSEGGSWYYYRNGKKATGWLDEGGQRYYLDPSTGARRTGWVTVGSQRYWFRTSAACGPVGSMGRGWLDDGGQRYFLDRSSGAMRTGWLDDGGRRYWLRTDASCGPVGSMGRGWLDQGGRRYFLDRTTGAAATGVHVVDGRVCNFASDGALASDGPLNAWYDASWRPSSSTVSGSKVHYFDAGGREAYTRTTNTPVMGSPSMSKDAFVKAFAARIQASYPQAYRTDAKYGATTPEAFAQAAWDAATSEGVRPEVLAAQVGNETGWLRFGGIVNADQCNFGGLGALDGNANGNAATFATVQQGLLAQAQHLKAYSSKAALNRPCVDPRFNLVTRGIAPYLEDYGADGHGGLVWASNRLYGRDLLAAMRSITG